MTVHYVDNKQLYACIVEYRTGVLESKKNSTPKPKIPEYIGECVLLIANRLSTKPNFVNYPFREEMVSDGIENCICYIDNFDPLKSDNPFAYFTQIIYYAFLRRIQKEKKQLYIKHKTLENSMIFNDLVTQSQGEDRDIASSLIDITNDNMYDFIKSFEDGLDEQKVKRKKSKKKGIDQFIEEDAPVELIEEPEDSTNPTT
jgi:hypothetical protein